MLYDDRPLYRRSEPSDRRFYLQIMIVLMGPILLFAAVAGFGHRLVFYLGEGNPVQALSLLAP
jgi:hypothetical protein